MGPQGSQNITAGSMADDVINPPTATIIREASSSIQKLWLFCMDSFPSFIANDKQ